MIASLAYIFLLGLAFAAVCAKLKLPRIIGMLAAGIILGPYALNMLDTGCVGGFKENSAHYYSFKGRTVVGSF